MRILIVMVGALAAAGCGAPAQTCETGACGVSSKSYLTCAIDGTDSVTYEFGGMSCSCTGADCTDCATTVANWCVPPPPNTACSGQRAQALMPLEFPLNQGNLEFPDTTIGQTSDPLTIGMRNEGGNSIMLMSVTADDPSFIIDTSAVPMPLPVGTTAIVSVTSMPTTTTAICSKITISFVGFNAPLGIAYAQGRGM